MKPSLPSTSRRIRALVGAVAVVATIPLVLTGCSGQRLRVLRLAKTLTIEDYYAANYNPIYKQCAKTVGAKLTINHVAGAGLIAKVLQQASSKTLPDVLMLDNPDVQQIAASGALSDLGDYGLDANGDVARRSRRRTPTRASSTACSRSTNSIALYYNKKLLADGRRHAAQDLGRAAGRREEAHQRADLRLRDEQHQHLRGHLAVPAVLLVERRRREEHRHPARPRRRCSSSRTCRTTARCRRARSTGPRPT